MSSRAAASRKRLVPGEHTRPSSSKSFFSRSKPTLNSQSTPIDLTEPDALQPQAFKLSNNTNNDFQVSSPYRSNSYTKPDPFIGGKIGASPQAFGKVASGPIVPSSPYPSPPHDVGEHAPQQIIRLTTRSPRGNGPNEYESTFIEASYQPPPPIQASYQPPPPTHPLQVNEPHNTTHSGRKFAPPTDPIPSFPAPPNYPPPLPSTPNRKPRPALPSPPSSTQRSLLLQRSSPTPTELPTYSSVHEIPYSTPSTANRIPFEVPVNSSPLSHFNNSPLPHHGRPEYSQRYDPTPYPSSPSPRPQRFTPSPYQAQGVSPVRAAASLPAENDFRRLGYRGGSSDETSSPFLSAYQVPSANPTHVRPAPESLSGSSDSSVNSKSPSSQNGSSSAASPAFVFPGSRSVARPKASAKTGAPMFGIKVKTKARARQNSDASLTTPPPTPSSAGSNDSRSPVGPSGTVPRASDPRMVDAQRQLHLFSEPTPAFGDNTGDRSLNSVVNSTWTAPNSTVMAATSPTSPNPASPNPANAPPKMVYPGGRSRAKPSRPPVIKPKKPKHPASAGDEREREERSRFMGLLKRKKQPKAGSSGSSGTRSQSSSFGNISPAELRSASATTNEGNSQSYEPRSADFARQEAIDRAQRAKSRIGSYPLDPYDSVLLDNDRHTGELLVRLNPTGSPSFHNYGNMPPVSVLDLGCGQGHWVVDAAIAWRGYGTKVTGYDMVDISRGLLPWAAEQGVTENIRFVRGNFLKQRLPFTDNSFDLVRMSCLALCITSDSWVFLLQEVCRVLMVGGRLELIDDLVFFPYGKASSALDLSAPHSPTQSIPPKLDITIPSPSFTTFSIYDEQVTNPGLGLPISGDEDGNDEDEFFDLYEVEEEPDFDDTATLTGREPRSTLPPSLRSRTTSRQPRSRASSPVISQRSWNRAQATSGDLEALFDHMLGHKFGIRKDLNDFILDLLKDVFGHAREMRTMHLALAPPETELEAGNLSTRRGTGLSGSRGLILWPSTFIPMSQAEIEIHASKHLRMLLSCKNFLLEHALEATDDEEIDEESVLEALWEYEGFLRHRFNPPPLQSSPYDEDSDTVSVRGSIAESVSSDSREAMWEIQSEFREHFVWQRSASSSRSPTPKDDTPRIHAFIPSVTSSSSQSTIVSPVLPSVTARNPHRDTDVVSSKSAPLYSRDELTRVRTFRIYEAIKIDEALFGSAM